MKLIVYLEPAEEGGYVATVPSLPGCVSEGETKEDALHNILDAVEGYVEAMRKHGREDEFPKTTGEVETLEVAAL